MSNSAKHILSSLAIVLAAQFLVPLWAAALIALACGAAKELVWDKWLKKGTPEWKDIICDAVGVAAGVVLSLLLMNWKEVRDLRTENERFRQNSEVLIGDIEKYRVSDSLNAARARSLEMTLDEYRRFRAEDAATIEQMRQRNRELESVTATQMQTINRLKAQVRDSIVYLPGDTIKVEAQCIDIVDRWFEMHGCIAGGEFNGTMVSRDSLLIAITVERKRFLGFLWRTRKVKNRQVDIVSRNPATEILGVELDVIDK